jgi:hypothetical protein
MMDHLKSLLFNAAPLALLTAWLHTSHSGLMNLALFIIWALFVPAAILVACETKAERMKRTPRPSLLQWIFWALRLATLTQLVWLGFWFTGIGYGIAMAIIFGVNEEVRKQRVAAAAATEGAKP